MILTCIAIDDEPLALRVIEEFASRHPSLDLRTTFNRVKEAKTYLQNTPVDLLFLDIHMRETNGVTFAQQLTTRPLLIFTTAFREYAVDGFELDAIDYLLKPFDYSRFEKAVAKALDRKNGEQKTDGFITVYEEYRLVKIYYSDIEYIEGMQDYVKIHLIDGTKVMTLSTLKSMMEKLPSKLFLRIHRSFIVSVKHIHFFANKKIQMNSRLLNVGESYVQSVYECLTHSSRQ